LRANLSRIESPVLVVQAAEDPLVRRDATHKLLNWLGGKAIYKEVPGDHNLNQPAHPGYAEMEQAVLEFAHGVLSAPHIQNERET
jgi:surfactin synthase thioesterase subunit